MARLAALDTKVLLAIQSGIECAEMKAYRLLKEDEFLFRATPTILQELEKVKTNTECEYGSALAENLLNQGCLLALNIVDAPFTDVETQVTEIHVNRLVEKDPRFDDERGDLSALIEAAYVDCDVIVTTRPQLLENRKSLTLALMRMCGMPKIFVLSPEEIVDFFKN